LTDLVEIAASRGLSAVACIADEAEVMGVNDRVQLAAAEAAMQRRLRDSAMRAGATMIAPETVFLSYDTELGRDVTIEPHVVFGRGCRIAGAKVNHLSYIGDARVGAGANIGAGTITCNYDGFSKFKTDIGAGAFIGSNSALVAPVKVGDGAIVGAGSVVTKDVAADALALARGRQAEKPGWAKAFRDAHKEP
jgi:bifunctional UDP-N-acetylglucosamine pyrophosphorylase/glucosamine-1-phosphate N-acetyltransferase